MLPTLCKRLWAVKSYAISLCSLWLALTAVGFAQDQGIGKSPEKDKAFLESVLKTPDQLPPENLFVGAKIAYEQNRIEDSGFLFYAGRFRANFDMACFPPTGRGGDDPGVAIAAISETLGSVINPAVTGDPRVLAKVLERLKHWAPKVPKDYQPGYAFSIRKSEKEAYNATQANRSSFFSHMEDFNALLNDPEYLAAFHVVQAYNLSPDKQRPTKEAFEKASETMKRIAKAKGKTEFSQ